MDTEKQNRFTRVIIVKKKKIPTTAPKVGIDRFDEYIEKSGLESKSYQREGVAFCLRRECRGGGGGGETGGGAAVVGGIIADEMGLGKTIVMMGLILANLAAYRRTLIVVPVALIAQWVAQIKKTIIDTGVKPDLVVAVYHGVTGKRRVVVLSAEGSGGADGSVVWCHRPPKRGGGAGGARARVIDIVITTYGCVAMEEPAKNNAASSSAVATPTLSLLTFRADRVIFDEAHHLRNKNSRIFKGAMRVVAATKRPSVWIVTGTPIQNKISDLKSLCYVLGFGVGDLISEEKRRAIRDEYVLRRTKVSVGMVVEGGEAGVEGDEAGVAGDEAGVAGDVTCAPRLQSLKHYKTNVPWSSETELDLSREIHQKAKNTTDRAERLKLYTRMRQMCVWPALVSSRSSNTKKTRVEEVDNDGDMMDAEETHGLSMDEFHVAVSKQSKLDRVVATMTAEAAGGLGRKSIVFCHYRREMTQLRDMLLRSGVVVGGEDDIAIIDGTVGPRERSRIFAAAPTVLILQIRTCSEGLNLQSYSDVYFISPHWNPCVEDQAIARCYRMGQTSQVRVFRFYMTDFILEQSGSEQSGSEQSGGGEEEVSGGVAGAESISTLDHKCEEIQERKRVLCNEFLCGGV